MVEKIDHCIHDTETLNIGMLEYKVSGMNGLPVATIDDSLKILCFFTPIRMVQFQY